MYDDNKHLITNGECGTQAPEREFTFVKPWNKKVRSCSNGCGVNIYQAYFPGLGYGRVLNVEDTTERLHCCPEGGIIINKDARRKKQYKCYHCKAEIIFDDSRVSKNQRSIPLNIDGISTHDCLRKFYTVNAND